MKIRGRRECSSCGTQWSYYETGSVECPGCGSLRSVGVDERRHHTDAPVEFDLSPVRNRIDDDTRAVAEAAAEAAGEYVRQRGFLDAGALGPLDETYVAATLLRHVGTELARELRPTEDEELFLLDLLRGADEGERPPAEETPAALRSAHGLAMAAAVAAYHRDVRTYLEGESAPEARSLAGRVRDRRKRVEALDGDVDPADADRLVHAMRDVGRYLRTGEESALVTADNWLQGTG